MLKISKLADYATVIMTFLAQHHGERHSASHIAEKTHLSLPVVTKLLKRLAKRGLLKSIRGTQGGYELNAVPSALALTDIIAAIDGDFAMTQCSHAQKACVHEQHCDLRSNWRYLNGLIANVLRSVTLAHLCEGLDTQPLIFHPRSNA